MTDKAETIFTFRNIDSSDAIKEHAEDKLSKLDKFLYKAGNTHCIFKVEGARHIAEIVMNVNGHRFVGEDSSNDMYTSIDGAVDKLRNALVKDKEKIKAHKIS